MQPEEMIRAANRIDLGDLQTAMHTLIGLFQALHWLSSGLLDDATTDQERADVRHELILAGKMITDRIVADF